MVPSFKRTSKEDPACQRYPEVLWPLLSLEEPDEKTDYHQLAQPLAAYVPDLIQMALDDDLNYREQDDPAVWAPLHGMQILGALGAVEAAEPLTQCLEWNNDWYAEALPDVYASIGPAAIPVLQAYLEDATHDMWGRIHASHALAAIVQAHPEARDSLVPYMTAYLDRPTADDNAEEELVTTFVITDLADLEAREAYPAIKRAYQEDRVDLSVIGLEDVEVDLEMRPKPDYSKLETEPPKEPGVRLELKCKVCGRERSYLFPKVYCDLGTLRDEKKQAKYDPIIIPQPVVCSKCGAVDQYELAGMGHIALIADVLAQSAPEMKGLRREGQHVQYMEFEALGRKMHPLEAIERYQEKIARHPDDNSLYVGYGNVLRFLGRFDEARAQYQRAMELDPLDPYAYADMATLALKQHNKVEAIAMWQQVLEVVGSSGLPDQDKQLVLESAREAIKMIRAGREDELIPEPGLEPSSAGGTPASGKARPSSKRTSRKREANRLTSGTAWLPKGVTGKRVEVGRNAPCPCGSGKKYKHCCMRKKRR
jgi:tetratricopeptide (TPR) repeat protein